MFHDSVDFVSATSLLVDGPSLIHVTDYLQRVAYLSLDRCATYLALRRSITKECLTDLGETIDNCILHAENSDTELKASHWPAMLKSKASAFVYLRLSRRSPHSKHGRGKGGLMLTGPKTPALIEYRDLDSDNDLPDDESMALILRPPRSVSATLKE